jgi:hypothetical protein
MIDENLEVWDRDTEIDRLKDQIAILQTALICDRAKLLDIYYGIMNGIPERVSDDKNVVRAQKMLREEYWELDWDTV